MKTIILFGIRRSGNHFLISTILQQYQNYVHINDVELSYQNYIKYRSIDKYIDRIDNKWIGFKEVECVVISIENKEIDFIVLNKFNTIDDVHLVILLRCSYNNMSSVWKVYNKDLQLAHEIINLWKIYAKIFISDNNLIKVLYDEYSSNNEYIITILYKLDIKNITLTNKDEHILHSQISFILEAEVQRKYDTLESCIYKDDITFVTLLEDKELYDLWNSVKALF